MNPKDVLVMFLSEYIAIIYRDPGLSTTVLVKLIGLNGLNSPHSTQVNVCSTALTDKTLLSNLDSIGATNEVFVSIKWDQEWRLILMQAISKAMEEVGHTIQ
jgi:hypothetical protein